MQTDIHPSYQMHKTICSCGAEHEIYSNKSPKIEICANCHPFYTGKQKLVDTAGRVDKFNKRFGKRSALKVKDESQDDSEEKS